VWGDATLAIYKLTAKFVPSKVSWEGSSAHLLALKAQREAAVTHAVVAATGAIADAAVAAFEKTLQASVSAATGACGGDSTTPSANQEELDEDETTSPESTTNAAEPSSAANSAGSAEKAAAASEQTLVAATGAADKGAAAREPLPAWMQPGTIVLLSVKRNKELYDARKGKVEAVLSREIKVLMLEGPKKGEVVKMNPMSLSRVAEQEPLKKLFPETAATMAPPQPPPQKKQKTVDQEWADAEALLGV
jgi:hypothetical protein